jgi:hypothetical protein
MAEFHQFSFANICISNIQIIIDHFLYGMISKIYNIENILVSGEDLIPFFNTIYDTEPMI